MKVLIVKTSSMGDIIHTLPALTDASKKLPNIRFDWVVEESFAEIPTWHPLVDKVIPIALRRWRKNLSSMLLSREWQTFYKTLRQEKYDLVIDAQGLIKSGFVAYFARGLRCGLDRKSAWEPLASWSYQKKCRVSPNQHAITRMRQLFSLALNYPYEENVPDYGIKLKTKETLDQGYLVFLHGTTWKTKEWPEKYWIELTKLVAKAGYKILLPWGSTEEFERASRIHSQGHQTELLPKLNLAAIANILVQAKAIIAVDTGLGHLAAALNVPTISLYGPTDPKETGTCGQTQEHLVATFACAPCLSAKCHYKNVTSAFPACFVSITPELVWQQIQRMLKL